MFTARQFLQSAIFSMVNADAVPNKNTNNINGLLFLFCFCGGRGEKVTGQIFPYLRILQPFINPNKAR